MLRTTPPKALPVGPSGCQALFMYAAVLRQASLSANIVCHGVLWLCIPPLSLFKDHAAADLSIQI